MKSVLSRLEHLEKINSVGGVALLILQPDETWELSLSGKRYPYQTEAEAKRRVKPEQPLIIIDL